MSEVKVCYYGKLVNYNEEVGDITNIRIEEYNDIIKKEAFALVTDSEAINPIEFDKEFRNKLKYEYIFIYKKYLRKTRINKFNNFIYIDKEDLDNINSLIRDLKKKAIVFNKMTKGTISAKKKKMLDDIYAYIKDKEVIKTEELTEKFNISVRNVERYLHDINIIHNIIGYDYDKKVYYICNKGK